jgi:hypothetical protein
MSLSLKDLFRKGDVRIRTLNNAHLEPTEHDGQKTASINLRLGRAIQITRYLPSSACASDHVKVLAWLGRGVWVDGFHQLFQDLKGRKAAHPTPVQGEETQLLASHGENRSSKACMRLNV